MEKHVLLTTTEPITEAMADEFIETLASEDLAFWGGWSNGKNEFDGDLTRVLSVGEDPTDAFDRAMEKFPYVGSYTVGEYLEQDGQDTDPQ